MIKREQIEEYVFRRISKEGIKAVRMSDIAAGLKVSKATLYECFSTKSELVESCVINAFNQVMSKMNRTSETIANSLKAMVFMSIDFFKFKMSLSQLFLEELAEQDSMEKFFLQMKKEACTLGNRFMQSCISDGFLTNLESFEDLNEEFARTAKIEQEYDRITLTSREVFDLMIVSLMKFATPKGKEILLELRENYS